MTKVIEVKTPTELPPVYYAYLPEDKDNALNESISFFSAKFGEFIAVLFLHRGVYALQRNVSEPLQNRLF